MATRKEIKEEVVSTLRSATDGLVDVNNIRYYHGNMPEESPCIAYTFDVDIVSYNNASASPDEIRRSVGGYVTAEVWHEYNEASVIIIIQGDDTGEIYEAVHTAFGKYALGHTKISDFHADLTDYGIRVENVNDLSEPDEYKTIRRDAIGLSILFKRDYEASDEPMEDFNITLNFTID